MKRGSNRETLNTATLSYDDLADACTPDFRDDIDSLEKRLEAKFKRISQTFRRQAEKDVVRLILKLCKDIENPDNWDITSGDVGIRINPLIGSNSSVEILLKLKDLTKVFTLGHYGYGPKIATAVAVELRSVADAIETAAKNLNDDDE